MPTPKRPVDIAVISDVHLGTPACAAAELLLYLKSIRPRILVLNGDIIDMWQFSRNFWPEAHVKVVRRILKLAAEGVPVYYITGNHDEALRRYSAFSMGNLHLLDRLELTVDGKRVGFFHGDVFDLAHGRRRWLKLIGGFSYDVLVAVNRQVNRLRRWFGCGQVSLAAAIKRNLATATSWIDQFENACADFARDHGYDQVVCGHIHQPRIREFADAERTVTYLNSGDWVENLTALEYADGAWRLAGFAEMAAAVDDDTLEETVGLRPRVEAA